MTLEELPPQLNIPAITFDDVLIVPAYSEVETRESIDTSVDFLGLNLQIPIISANMDYVTGPMMAETMFREGGLGILHRFADWDYKQTAWLDELDGHNIPTIFSVGIRDIEESFERAVIAADNFPNVFAVCIDVAHGHHKKVADLTRRIKQGTRLKVIAGNVATADGAMFLRDAGADAVKVGIGAGAVCTTRLVAGVGVPQLSAILDCADLGVPIISDGGIRNSADIAKALIAGATVVMAGSVLAGATECPSPTVIGTDNRKYRPYRGQSIFGVNGERYVKEGVEGYVEDKGPTRDILRNLQAGLRSSMSYVGASTIEALRTSGKFVTVTHSTIAENHPRVRQII